MSTDAELITWLRRTPLYDCNRDDVDDLADEAADRLAALIAERDSLKEAVWQALDDMGETGQCVCPAAKKQLAEAYALSPTQEKGG